MSVMEILLLVMQLLIGIGLVPVFRWMFKAEASLQVLLAAIVQLQNQMTGITNTLHSRPCDVHQERLDHMEEQLKELRAIIRLEQ